ncbi:hypothetical protein Y032_0262g577 [Ancylostoma ceylanicum]|uniref:Uncharacterized protein n=1 Tax=Ancylostoma ceylanicum TaxID=53326 RepID=A0A016SAQ1_9BILA|nr:hypothetical protein Y032_0262g577 [Ancylostoma ceylanicum]
MPAGREAIKCSLLQQKTTRRTGTLRRKKKVEYGEACWVVLCVHDDKIPILEWYHGEDSVKLHQPFKVLDLLFANYVSTVVADSRSFIIGLRDLEPIELAALHPEVCSEWVSCTTETLRRLSILDGSTNIYGASPLIKKCEFNETNSILDTPIPPPAQMSTEASPRHRVFPHDPHCMNRGSQFHTPHSIKPPLPPRSNIQFPNRPHTVSTDSEARIEDTTYDVLTSQVYDTLSPGASSSNVSSSPLQSTLSTTSLCSSLSSELRLSSSIPPGEISSNDYDCLRSGHDHPVKSVSLNLSVLVEQVLFVEVAGRVWVAGWSEANDRQLSQLFNFGDELIEVENTPVQGLSNIPQLFYTLSTPGTPVNLLLRPTPFGVTYRLMKPIMKNKEIGIRLHKNKNRIAAVLPDSSADRRNIPVSMPSPIRPGVDTAVVITEVNKRRLNPFSKNDQLFKRLDEIRDGSEFTIVLQPHDFVKQMKQQILGVHHYKAYLCQQ